MSDTEARLQTALNMEAHRSRMIQFVRGYAAGRGNHLADGWDMLEDVSESALAEAIGDAASGEEAVSRVSLQLGDLTACL